MIAEPRLIVAITSTGPSTFGRMWLTMIRDERNADDARCHDVFLAALDHRGAAHGASELRPERDADREHQNVQLHSVMEFARQHGTHDAVDEERDQDCGKGELHVGDAHQHCVDEAADITGDKARPRCRR